jgi:hypothetical protein
MKWTIFCGGQRIHSPLGGSSRGLQCNSVFANNVSVFAKNVSVFAENVFVFARRC